MLGYHKGRRWSQKIINNNQDIKRERDKRGRTEVLFVFEE
jgi:hypothetical protein